MSSHNDSQRNAWSHTLGCGAPHTIARDFVGNGADGRCFGGVVDVLVFLEEGVVAAAGAGAASISICPLRDERDKKKAARASGGRPLAPQAPQCLPLSAALTGMALGAAPDGSFSSAKERVY